MSTTDPAPFASWHRLAAGDDDLVIEGRSSLHIHFQDGRSHRLNVIEETNGWRLRGLIVRHALDYSDTPILDAALRNRQISLTSLLVDEVGHLVGEILVPSAGTTASEFQTLARHLAAECDRQEFMLTGADREGK